MRPKREEEPRNLLTSKRSWHIALQTGHSKRPQSNAPATVSASVSLNVSVSVSCEKDENAVVMVDADEFWNGQSS